MNDDQPKTPPGLSCPVCHERFSPTRDGTVAWAHHVGVKCKIPKGKPYPPPLFGTDGDLRAKISAAFDAAQAGRLRPNAQAIARDSNGSYDVLSDLSATVPCGSPAPEAIQRQLSNVDLGCGRQFSNVDLVCGEPAGHADDCVATVLANFGQPTMRVRWARPAEGLRPACNHPVGEHSCDLPEGHQLGHMAITSPLRQTRSIVGSAEDLLELAWGVIANAGWRGEPKTTGWDEAAAGWRDLYFDFTRSSPTRGLAQQVGGDHVAGHVGADGRFYAHREIEKGEVFKARIGAEAAPWLEPKGGLCAACGIVSSAQPPALDPPGWMVVDFPAGSDRCEEKQLCPPCGEKVAKFIAHLSTPMLHEEDLL